MSYCKALEVLKEKQIRVNRRILHGEGLMYGLNTGEDAPEMQDSRRKNAVHLVHKVLQVFIGKFMTPNHGNYRRNNLRYLRRVKRGSGKSPTRQRLMQDVPRGIYVRVLSHPAFGAVISLASPVFSSRPLRTPGASL